MNTEILPLTDLRASFDNDADILGSILDMFMEEVPQDYLLLTSSIESGDYTAAGMQAHKVKSSYRTLGIDSMAGILQEIENRAKNQENMEEIPGLLDQFNENYALVNEQVRFTKEQL